MKKILGILVVSLSFMLTACAKDPLSQRMVEDIKSIGEVTLDDEVLIVELENTYLEMTDKQKDQVNNYIDLKDARKKLDELKTAEAESIAQEQSEAEAEAIANLEAIASQEPYNYALALAVTLRDSLYDPSSFQLYSVKYKENSATYSDYYLFDYGGKNQLGGTSRKTVVIGITGYNSNIKIYEEDDIDFQDEVDRFSYDSENLDVNFILSYIENY